MSVTLSSIADRGDFGKERIVMKVASEADIGRFAMFRARYNGKSVTTGVTDVFWFPDKQVKAGDRVVLYSKSGTDTQQTNEDGTTAHFFYWGRKQALWNSPDHSAVLLRIAGWHSIGPDKP